MFGLGRGCIVVTPGTNLKQKAFKCPGICLGYTFCLSGERWAGAMCIPEKKNFICETTVWHLYFCRFLKKKKNTRMRREEKKGQKKMSLKKALIKEF